MATQTMAYPGLTRVIGYIIELAQADIPYARQRFGKLATPRAVWQALKPLLMYRHDAYGIEQLQKLSTLLGPNNIHGVPGAGDCDCFSIAALTLLMANRIPCGIVLAGKSKAKPSHIYVYGDYLGKRYYLDLTNRRFNTIRSYPYYQRIPVA